MVASAQKPHFVYLQSDNNQPFFVMLNKKNYSSSSVGHVIIPGLTNGSYSLTIGYAGQNASQAYDIEINNADQGFVIKSFDEGKNYGLLNLQTAQVQLSGASQLAAAEAEKQKAIAAEAEKQKALAAEAALKEEQRKADELAAQQKAAADQKAVEDSISAAQKVAAAAIVAAPVVTKPNDAPPTEVKTEAQKEATSEKTAEVQKLAIETKSTGAVSTGTEAVAAGTVVAAGALTAAEIAKLQEEARRIDAQGKRDSVLNAQKQTNTPAVAGAPVFLDMDFTMPVDSLKAQTEAKKADSLKQVEKATAADSVTAKETSLSGADITQPDTVKVAEGVVASQPDSVKPSAVVVASQPDSVKAAIPAPAKNPNCVNEASDSDIELVGMLIKSEKDVEESLELARKTMKLKCATTAQVRKLALLFENQEERYRLLDGAYKYTSDRQNYGNLADLLTDTYYLNRFKAMLQ
jgi:hypothetical protein